MPVSNKIYKLEGQERKIRAEMIDIFQVEMSHRYENFLNNCQQSLNINPTSLLDIDCRLIFSDAIKEIYRTFIYVQRSALMLRFRYFQQFQ